MNIEYGIITTGNREYLSRTVTSLKDSGFENPTVFLDGSQQDYIKFSLSLISEYWISKNSMNLGNFSNWYLAALELFLRNPQANRYIIFEDDLVCSTNLRPYIESLNLEDDSYYNLWCNKQNEKLIEEQEKFYTPKSKPKNIENSPWYETAARGKGALALMLPNTVLQSLLTSSEFLGHRLSRNGLKGVDGAIFRALAVKGIKEKIHYPSLVQHIGEESTLGTTGRHLLPSKSFLGEDYNLLQLLEKQEK